MPYIVNGVILHAVMSSLEASRTVQGTQAPKPDVGQSLVARAVLCEYLAPAEKLFYR